MNKKYDVVGIGHALVDMVYPATDEFLHKNLLVKGQMGLCDGKRMAQLRKQLTQKPDEIAAGGSCGNTIALLARLGAKTAFIGRIAKDQQGENFKKAMTENGALASLSSCADDDEQDSDEANLENYTGQCIVFISPDAQRSFATHLGSAARLHPNQIDRYLLAQAKFIYLEGYLLGGSFGTKILQFTAEQGKLNRSQIALSLSDPSCVEQHREQLCQFIEKHVRLLFANEAEAKALFRVQGELRSDKLKANLEKKFTSLGLKVCITFGSDGACVIDENANSYFSPSQNSGRCIDTSGAGDAFAAGMLYALANGWNMQEAAKLANTLGAAVVAEVGPRLTKPVEQFIELARKA